MPELRHPPGNGGARLGPAGRKLGERSEVYCGRKRKVVPRVEGSISQPRNQRRVRTPRGEAWRRKQAQRYKLGHASPELWW